jgi:hypothetical protein
MQAILVIACVIGGAAAGAAEIGAADDSNGIEPQGVTTQGRDYASGSNQPGATPDDSSERALEAKYLQLEQAWKTYLKKRRDHEFQLLEIQMAAFLNEAANGYPESPWTLRGVELYCESRLVAAANEVKRYRDFNRGLSMLKSAKAYYDLLGATPDDKLLKTIERYARKVDS